MHGNGTIILLQNDFSSSQWSSIYCFTSYQWHSGLSSTWI